MIHSPAVSAVRSSLAVQTVIKLSDLFWGFFGVIFAAFSKLQLLQKLSSMSSMSLRVRLAGCDFLIQLVCCSPQYL